TCAFGCAAMGQRCNDLEPANGLGPALDVASNESALVLTGTATIDTSAGTIADGDGHAIVAATSIAMSGGREIFVVSVGSLTCQDVQVVGTRALAIVAAGDVKISGLVSLSADHDAAGAGAVLDPGLCRGDPARDASPSFSASGGGGFGLPGGRGGGAWLVAGGAGGLDDGDATNVPLRGGCTGGFPPQGAHELPSILTSPGAGGGAVQVSTRGTITISGMIAANGGGAKGFTGMWVPQCLGSAPCARGLGGGSGGAILLEAANVVVLAGAGIVANGGAGHFGQVGFASNGLLSEDPAPGSFHAGYPKGGDGGALGSPAEAGESGGNTTLSEGAGGGGGVGRIRINLPPGATFDQGPPIISPAATIGSVGVR
ncbi:MAG: hypothetical protein R3F45_17130, partial [Gammaproteobacteria bacterium]